MTKKQREESFMNEFNTWHELEVITVQEEDKMLQQQVLKGIFYVSPSKFLRKRLVDIYNILFKKQYTAHVSFVMFIRGKEGERK